MRCRERQLMELLCRSSVTRQTAEEETIQIRLHVIPFSQSLAGVTSNSIGSEEGVI
jgi:hypothetical protein